MMLDFSSRTPGTIPVTGDGFIDRPWLGQGKTISKYSALQMRQKCPRIQSNQNSKNLNIFEWIGEKGRNRKGR